MFGETQYNSYVVERLVVGVVGGCQDMVARPFMMHTGQNALDEFIINTDNGLNITQQSVQMTNNNNIIQLTAEGQGTIEIDGQWSSGRNVFSMIIRNVNDHSKFILSGFTSPDFMPSGGEVNPYATLTFNSVIELQAITNYDGSVKYQLHNSDNILSVNSLNGSVHGQQVTTTQRPVDVLDGAMLRSEVMSESSSHIDSNTPIVNLGLVDSMGSGGRSPQLSRASNAAGNDYLYRTTRAFSDAKLTGSANDDLNHHLHATATNQVIGEGSYQEMPLINTILTNAASKRNATISFGELEQTLTNLRQVTTVHTDDNYVDMSGTEHWGGRGEVRIQAELAAAIPAIMLKLGIQLIGFQMTSASAVGSMDGYNNTFLIKQHPDGSPMVGFITGDLPENELLSSFIAYMRNVVFPTATSGYGSVVLDVECSVVKNLVMSTSIDNANPLVRGAPTFASSMWNPANTTTTTSNTSMADGMLNLTAYISSSQDGNASPGTMVDDYAGDTMTYNPNSGAGRF